MNLAFGIAMFLLGLIGLISIIGVFWAQYKKRSKKPWVISIVTSAVFFLGSVMLYSSLLTPEQKSLLATQREQQRVEQVAQAAPDAQKKEGPAVITQGEQSTTDESTSPESILASIANKKLGSNFKKIEVNGFVDDPSKKVVLVHYRGNVGYDNAATKKAMLVQTADLFKEMFNSGVSIQEVNAFIYADMKGPSGSGESLAMKCQLKINTAAAIKWNNINKTTFDKNLDYIWLSPAFNN